jgi:predicted DNA-binding protein with PD1-like motif
LHGLEVWIDPISEEEVGFSFFDKKRFLRNEDVFLGPEVTMKAKLINEVGEKTYAVIFDRGDEVVEGLLSLARQKKVQASHFTAIGAFFDVTLGYFNWTKKTYDKIFIKEQVEVLSLVGNIVFDNGDPKLHAHIVIGKSDGTAHGGHLLEGHVRPVLEVILVESPSHLQRKIDKETGIALITFEPD